MSAFIRVVSRVLLFLFAGIGLALLLILWDIRHHPLSVFRHLHLLQRLPL